MVDAAGSGTEGLRRALEGDYDLIILDLIMPDLDGRRFLTRLLHERREQGVLVLSCLRM
jgi:DNA-binding response OmpR family regulator